MSDRAPKFYHTTKPNPSQITADEEDSRLVWKYQRDEYGHCLEADFYFTRVFVVLVDAYTAQLKRIYIFHLHIDGDAFIGTGDTLREAYRDAWKVYREAQQVTID